MILFCSKRVWNRWWSPDANRYEEDWKDFESHWAVIAYRRYWINDGKWRGL